MLLRDKSPTCSATRKNGKNSGEMPEILHGPTTTYEKFACLAKLPGLKALDRRRTKAQLLVNKAGQSTTTQFINFRLIDRELAFSCHGYRAFNLASITRVILHQDNPTALLSDTGSQVVLLLLSRNHQLRHSV